MELEFQPSIPANFKKLSKNKQIEFMRDWFLSRYEDPAQHTPHDSSEGGYFWIYGGPFDAEEVLRDNFEEIAKSGAIDELNDDLLNESWEWTRTIAYDYHLFHWDEDEDFYEFDGALEDYELIGSLQTNLQTLKGLIEQKRTLPLAQMEFSEMMIFSFSITSLESYLSDIFTRIIFSSDAMKGKFLKSDKELSTQKIALGDVFDQHSKIDITIKQRISRISFHNLPLVKSLFHAVLIVDLGDISQIMECVEKRHDFIHRGGRDGEGRKVKTSVREIRALIKKIESFCLRINKQLEEKKLIKLAPF